MMIERAEQTVRTTTFAAVAAVCGLVLPTMVLAEPPVEDLGASSSELAKPAAADEPAATEVPTATEVPAESEDDVDMLGDIADFSLEELLMVTSTSKRAQDLQRASATITVITAEEIRRLGAIHLSEILARVVGVTVARPGRSQWQNSARAVPSIETGSSTLVMVDGMSVNIDFFGGIALQTTAVDLADIKQIEVIKGPGSALYGDHAMHMVVNIVTYRAAELDGTRMRTRLSLRGDERSNFATFAAGKRYDNGVDVKLSASYNEMQEWQDLDAERDLADGHPGGNTSLKHLHGAATVGYAFAEDHDVRLRLSAKNSRTDFMLSLASPAELTSPQLAARLDWNFGDLSVMAWSRSTRMRAKSFTSDTEAFKADSMASAVEANYALSADALGLSAIVGLEIKEQHIDSSVVRQTPYDPGSSTSVGPLMQYSPYFQADYTPFDDIDLSLVFGGRFDYADLGGNKLSMKSSLLYTPIDEPTGVHTFYFSFGPALAAAVRKLDSREEHFSVATGYANPTLTNVYGLIPVGAEQIRGIDMNFFLFGPGEGDNGFKPQRIDYWELGYRGRVRDLRVNADLFLYQYENRIVSRGGDEVYLGANDDAVLLGLPAVGNLDTGLRGIGGEFEARYSPTPWLSVYANYAYISLSSYDLDDSIGYTDVEDLLVDHNEGAPAHQVGGGAHLTMHAGLELDVNARWVDGYWQQALDSARIAQIAAFPARTVLNIRVGQRLWNDKAEISLFFYSVLDRFNRTLDLDDAGLPTFEQRGAEGFASEKPEAGAYVNFSVEM